jgi:hypothetical protein
LAGPEATVEGDTSASSHEPSPEAELAGAPSPAEQGSTGAAGSEWPHSPALDAAGENQADTRSWAAAPPGGAGAPESVPGSAAPRRSSRSWLAGIVGGLIGGGLVGLAAYLLPQERAWIAEVRGQLDQLRQSVSEIEQPASQGLLARVDALETAARSEELLPRLEAVEGKVAGSQDVAERLQAVESAGSSLGERIAAIEEQLASIEASAGSGAAPERVATLESDLSDLKASVARLQGAVPSAGAAGDQAVADLASRVGALEGRLGQAEGAGTEIAGLASRVGAVEQQLTVGRQEATSLTGQVGALSTRVDALAEGVEQLQQRTASTEQQRTQLATLAGTIPQLDAAIGQGKPFADLLDGLRDQEDPAVRQAVEALQPAAASGVPGLSALRNSFDAIASQIVHAAQAPQGDGLLQQAAGNLMSLVTVRPVGADVEGDGAAARVARAEAALDGGDLAGAISELEALDGPAAAAAAPWLAEARPRLAAEAALDTLRDRALQLPVERP